MNKEEVKELIVSGLKYIGFPDYDRKIDINLLFDIREYIFLHSIEWYEEKFPEAYKFDIGISRTKEDSYYDTDGLLYYLNDDSRIYGYKLYGGKRREEITQSICFLYNLKKVYGKEYYVYYYINEIDHFFTHGINFYLLNNGKECSFDREKGIKEIWTQLLH